MAARAHGARRRLRAVLLATLLLPLALVAMSSPPAMTQTVTWLGTDSTDWRAPNNWTGGIPVGGTDVVIPTIANPTILDGGAPVSIRTLFVGEAPGSTGELTVTNGAQLTMTAPFGNFNTAINVGGRGTGTLTINGGSIVTATAAFMVIGGAGQTPGGTGTVLVSGQGSQLIVGSSLSVGTGTGNFGGTGTLTVEKGALLNTGINGVDVGSGGTSQGTFNVTNATLISRGFGFGTSTAANRINLDGATLIATQGGHPVDFLLNFGTAANVVNIAAGGFTVDTAGFTLGTGSLANQGGFGADFVMSGVGKLTVKGGGTLTLNASQTFSGGLTVTDSTTVAAGAAGTAFGTGLLTVVDSGSTANLAGFDTTVSGLAGLGSVTLGSGTLTVNGAATNTFSGTISGTGGFTQSGTGTQILSSANNYTGPTNIYAGALVVNGSITSDTTVHAGTLGGTGKIAGDVVNSGTVAPAFGGAATPGAKLTIDGDYTGTAGSQLKINTKLGDETSLTDQLIVNGGAISGTTGITVTNIGGTGGITSGNGIPIVVAENGTTSTPTAFTLTSKVKASAFEYGLRQGQTGSAEDLASWYLCNTTGCVTAGPSPPPPPPPPPNGGPTGSPDEPLYRSEVAMHAVYGAMARQLGLLTLGTFHERDGDQKLATNPGRRTAAWGRVFGQHLEQSHSGQVRPTTEGEYVGIQAGIDAIQTVSATGHQDRAGLFAAYANANVDVRGRILATPDWHAGKTDLDATSFGAYWSHIAPTGWYTDAVIMGTAYNGDGGTFDGSNVGVSGTGFIASLEGGFPLLKMWGMTLEQQGQLVYQYINLDDARDPYAYLEHQTPDAFHGRIGWRLSADGLPWMFKPFLKANIWQDFAGKDSVTYEHTHEVVNRHRSTTLELGGGIVANLAPNVGFWIDSGYTMDIDGTEQEREAWRGTAGLRVTW